MTVDRRYDAVRRDDHLVDVVAAGQVSRTTKSQQVSRGGHTAPDCGDSSDPVITLLARWRSEVDLSLDSDLPAMPELEALMDRWGTPADHDAASGAAPSSEMVSEAQGDTETTGAVLPFRRCRLCRDEAPRHAVISPLRYVAGVGILVAALSSTLLIQSHDAAPGDPLWGLNKTIFTDHAGDIELASQVDDDLSTALRLMEAGDMAGCHEALAAAKHKVGNIRDSARRSELERRIADVESQQYPHSSQQTETRAPQQDAMMAPAPGQSAPTQTPSAPPAPSQAPTTSAPHPKSGPTTESSPRSQTETESTSPSATDSPQEDVTGSETPRPRHIDDVTTEPAPTDETDETTVSTAPNTPSPQDAPGTDGAQPPTMPSLPPTVPLPKRPHSGPLSPFPVAEG